MTRLQTLLATLVALSIDTVGVAAAPEAEVSPPAPQAPAVSPAPVVAASSPGAGIRRPLVVPVPRAGRPVLTLWVPGGSRHEAPCDVGLAGATAARVRQALEARPGSAAPVRLEVTTAYARFSVPLPPEESEAAARQAIAALLTPPASTTPAVEAEGWLQEAEVGPRLAGHQDAVAADVVGFHARHYRREAIVAVIGAAGPTDALAAAVAEALEAAASPGPTGAPPLPMPSPAGASAHLAPAAAAPEAPATASPPTPPRRWACLALQGPPPGAWAEEAALGLAGEVLAARLATAAGRPVEVSLERWPAACWLVLGLTQAPADIGVVFEAQVSAMRDDLVDLVELERARARWVSRRGDPRTDPVALALAVGYDAAVTGRPEGWKLEREAVGQVDREGLQAVMQRYGAGEGLRLLLPRSD